MTYTVHTIIHNESKPNLFADDTGIIVTYPNIIDFKNYISTVLNTWFAFSILCLNFEKMHYIQIISKNNSLADNNFGFSNKQTAHISTITFLGIVIDNSLSYKLHTSNLYPN
jgi:hypothetical protein